MDLFNENQQEGMTRQVQPVSQDASAVKSGRRRRTERFAGLIDDADMAPPADEFQPAPPAVQEQPVQETRVTPAVQEKPAQETRVTPAVQEKPVQGTRTQPRVPTQVPSQGIPRPAALNGQRPQRDANEQPAQSGPVVRRPVQAEGYAPLQQLGTQSRARRPEAEYTAPRTEQTRRVVNPETKFTGYHPPVEEEEKGGPRWPIVLIILLLMVAALLIGLLMIPEEDTGVLGSFKRAVTEPIKGLFGGGEEDDKTSEETASSFTATISQATAPYKVVFHMVTSSGVTAVRVVDESGSVIPTTTTLSTPSSETSVVWMFEMILQEGYNGSVQAQIQNGETWIDTGLTQVLSLGGATPPTVSDMPVSTLTGAVTPTAAPAVTPLMSVNTATPAPTDNVPQETNVPERTPEVTATPTMSVTATPTLMPTATPTAEPTEEPTPEPTAEPTPEPTPEPSPTPVVTPKLEAMAAEKAAPSLISETVIYKDDRKVKEYERAQPINMPASDAYLTRAFGVTTFRGNAFRQNAAVETVENPTSLSLAWTVEAGSVAGSSRNYYGIGWTGQPVIARWPADIRRSMNINDANKEQKYLTEVIVAGLDGKIYFLDLLDGEATRDVIDFGYPMRSTPSLHPLSFPLMTSGQYARKMKSGTSDDMGLYYYSLMNQKVLHMIDGIDRKLKRPYSDNASGAFDTSALIDRTTNTLVAIGTNGLLYTEKLSMSMQLDKETGSLVFAYEEPTESVTMMSHTKGQKEGRVGVESSLAMYGSYAYYADLDGVLRCVDTTTMTTVWAVNTGDSVRAAIALDLEEGESTNTLWLYTANLVNNRQKGNVTIRRYNAMTGEEDWAFAIHCADAKKKDVTFNAIVTPGAMASPVIGQHGLNDLVYFTLSSVSATGAAALEETSAIPGVIIALDKQTGEVVWRKTMEAYCYSSPVAVYDADGKGWIIQACSNGAIYLMDGLTGSVINTLQVNGVIEGSPAVYGDMMVIGTTGKDSSYIYGIKIN